MDCKHFKENLFAFEEDTLLPGQKNEFSAHLRSCAECSKIYAGFQSYLLLIEKEKSVEPNPFASTRILQYIESRPEQRSQSGMMNDRWRILFPALVAAGLLVGIFIGVYRVKSISIPDHQVVSQSKDIEILKSDLFISDFIDDDKTFLINR